MTPSWRQPLKRSYTLRAAETPATSATAKSLLSPWKTASASAPANGAAKPSGHELDALRFPIGPRFGYGINRTIDIRRRSLSADTAGATDRPQSSGAIGSCRHAGNVLLRRIPAPIHRAEAGGGSSPSPRFLQGLSAAGIRWASDGSSFR